MRRSEQGRGNFPVLLRAAARAAFRAGAEVRYLSQGMGRNTAFAENMQVQRKLLCCAGLSCQRQHFNGEPAVKYYAGRVLERCVLRGEAVMGKKVGLSQVGGNDAPIRDPK